MKPGIYLQEPGCTNQHLLGTQQQEQLGILSHPDTIKTRLKRDWRLRGVWLVSEPVEGHSSVPGKSSKTKVSVQSIYLPHLQQLNRKTLSTGRILCFVTTMFCNYLVLSTFSLDIQSLTNLLPVNKRLEKKGKINR